MAALENLLKELEVHFNVLKLNKQESNKVISKGKFKDIERKIKQIEDRIEKVNELKGRIQEIKLQQNETVEQVGTWGEELEARLEEYDESLSKLEDTMHVIKKEEETKQKEEEEERRNIMKRERYEDELKIEEAKIKMRIESEKRLHNEINKTEKSKELLVKLPKLEITKFEGTHLDWVRFWNQFESEIDKSQLSPVAKYSYLKELLVPGVRKYIDGLPFTSEGYTRAKTILQEKYGKPSEVANAHIQSIMSLQPVFNSNARKIHAFYERLVTNIQALDTMGKLKEIKGYVRLTLDKLPGIRADLVRTDDNWQDWSFQQLTQALLKWTERNPIPQEQPTQTFQDRRDHPREKLMQTSHSESRPRNCIYCNSKEHKTTNCDIVKSIEERRKILRDKKLCFNCTGSKHRASECTSKKSCGKCGRRHHTTVCDKEKSPFLTAGEATVSHPVVVVDVEGITCRALLDTGAGGSYASSSILEAIHSKPIRSETKRIDMMMTSTDKKMQIHKVTIKSLNKKFKINCEVAKVEKERLLSITNPKYKTLIEAYDHLKDITINDHDTKPELPIHLVLGASAYSQIKMKEEPRIGQPGQPIAEKTHLGWTIISPGKEIEVSHLLLLKSTEVDYSQLCNQDVLGLKDQLKNENDNVYERFKSQIHQDSEGWYETSLLWKEDHPPLPSNKSGSIARLNNLIKRLKRDPKLLEEYHSIIDDQLKAGVIEPAVNQESQGNQFYIPHKAVVREKAESTKVRIVYDASAKESSIAPSLNDCLETGPPLQNLIWSVILRNRMKPVAICGDIKQAFLQIRIREEDRDFLKFHWIDDTDPEKIITRRFTRALFGLTQSPFFLGATIQHHLDTRENYPKEIIKEIKESLYIDDLIGGGNNIQEAKELKETAIKVFQEATFTLHKWHSNAPQLETETNDDNQEKTLSYAKEQLGVKVTDTKLLGLIWDKDEDTLAIVFPKSSSRTTKRIILSTLASIYDPLGWASPITLQGKIMYRESCEWKLAWDKELPEELTKKWSRWMNALPTLMKVPRAVIPLNINIYQIELHAFGDASINGTAAGVYIIVFHSSGVVQKLLTAKSRLAKKSLSIPRLELTAAHMAANLVENVYNTLNTQQISSVHCWSDSTVVLQWLRSGSSLKQYVENRVNKIKEKSFIKWRYVPTDDNPADVGSRGCTIKKLPEMWFQGPPWLSNKREWPENIVTYPTVESEKETKQIKEIFAVAQVQTDEFDALLHKHELKRVLRIVSWMRRFVNNCRKETRRGPLITEEINSTLTIFIRSAQKMYIESNEYQVDKERLNIQENENKIMECRGRIQGIFPIYLPNSATLARKIVENAHFNTLHGGVGQTITKVRETYWIPKLRQLAKSIIHKCRNCKRYRATPYSTPPPGLLPKTRTEGSRPFQVIGVDYAGPIRYKANKKERKAYILLFSCSLTRAMHIQLVTDLSAVQFIQSFKKFISRRGLPEIVYSDNARTFQAASKWIKRIRSSEKLHQLSAEKNIQWRFNLSKAPWWGGQFERLIGMIKQSLYRTIGRTSLKLNELEEVLIDVEQTLNNRPLDYVEDDIELPILTPNSFLFSQPIHVPDLGSKEAEDSDSDLRRRYKYLKKCKDNIWKRWTSEYLRGLRERHQLKHKAKENRINIGDVVIIKGEKRNRGTWKIGIVTKLFPGKDDAIRSVRLRAGMSTLDRPIQFLYPLELHCDWPNKNETNMSSTINKSELNVKAKEFRPRRNAAAIAKLRIQDAADETDDDNSE